MHTLKNWTARRSGAFVTVNGTDERTGEASKVTATSVEGPCASRLCRPSNTVAWLKDGAPVVLI